MFYYNHINKPRPDIFTDTWNVCVYNAVNGYQIQSLFIFLRIRKSSCKILINKTFKIVGSVWKVEEEEKYFMKYFFLVLCVLNRNLNETSKNILFFCKYQISLVLIFFDFNLYLHATEKPKESWHILSQINFLSSHTQLTHYNLNQLTTFQG